MTTTFGDHATARELWGSYSVSSPWQSPKNLKLIGEGASRDAYLDKSSNLVYKIGDSEANAYEAYMARRLAKKSKKALGFNLHIPRTRTYRMPDEVYGGRLVRSYVTAQEYAANARPTECDMYYQWAQPDAKCSCNHTPCFIAVHEAIAEWSGLEDIHSENVLIDNNDTFWLIDLAL